MLTENTIFLIQSLHLSRTWRVRALSPVLPLSSSLSLCVRHPPSPLVFPVFLSFSRREHPPRHAFFLHGLCLILRIERVEPRRLGAARPRVINRYVTHCQLRTGVPVYVINPACPSVSRTALPVNKSARPRLRARERENEAVYRAERSRVARVPQE